MNISLALIIKVLSFVHEHGPITLPRILLGPDSAFCGLRKAGLITFLSIDGIQNVFITKKGTQVLELRSFSIQLKSILNESSIKLL